MDKWANDINVKDDEVREDCLLLMKHCGWILKPLGDENEEEEDRFYTMVQIDISGNQVNSFGHEIANLNKDSIVRFDRYMALLIDAMEIYNSRTTYLTPKISIKKEGVFWGSKNLYPELTLKESLFKTLVHAFRYDKKEQKKVIVHELKVLPEYFNLSYNRIKRYEIRSLDRGFKIDDYIYLKEFDAIKQSYTGRNLICKITHILKNIPQYGLNEEYGIISIKFSNEMSVDELEPVKKYYVEEMNYLPPTN